MSRAEGDGRGGEGRAGVVQAEATVLATRAEGAYRHLTLEVAGVAELARAGQFVSLAVGGPLSSTLLRRSFSLLDATDKPLGHGPGTVEIVVAAAGAGSRWLVEQPVGAVVDLVGPLGKPFPLPTAPVDVVLVGGGYGSAPLFWLARALRERGCRLTFVLGAATKDKLYGVERARDLSDQVLVTTDDGSLGTRGWVSDALDGLLRDTNIAVAYACGPMGMLRSVADLAAQHEAVAQVAVEEAMACGVGVCMTCVLPVVGRDGATRMVRSCVDGPTFRGDRVRWEAFKDGRCAVPADTVGAPRAPR